MIFEKAKSPDRDTLDLIVSLGWLYHISPEISLGVEGVGQDLEGFWERQEAEGGARILSGPAMHLNLREWEVGVAGGYVFLPTNSIRKSIADRAFWVRSNRSAFSLSRSF